MCNQCSFKIIADIKVKHNCPKCKSDLNNFHYLNRYLNGISNEENNTIIDLNDVNISGMSFNEALEIQKISDDKKEKREENLEIEENKKNSSNRNFKRNVVIPQRDQKSVEIKKETCQICYVFKSNKIIHCESGAPHLICSYCYNRMLKIDKIKLCPFCRTKIKKI